MQFIKKTALLVVAGIGIFCLTILLLIWRKIPSEDEIRGCLTTEMFQVHLCPGSANYVPMSKISKYLRLIVVMTEDSTFYTNHGIDWDSVEEVAKETIENHRFKRGGSTLTQQLAKNMFLNKEKTLIRKFYEALIAIKIDRTLSKSEILERYLNVVEFGKDIYGVKGAAKFYFKKSPQDLSAIECAFLAMLLPNPIKYSRSYFKHELTKFARSRITRIIGDLYRTKHISENEYELSVSQLENFLSTELTPTESAPDFSNEPSGDEDSSANDDDLVDGEVNLEKNNVHSGVQSETAFDTKANSNFDSDLNDIKVAPKQKSEQMKSDELDEN